VKRYLPFIIVIVVASITFGTGASLCRAYKRQVLTLSKEQAERAKGEAVSARGPAKAAVTVEEFGDFQCLPCGAPSELLNQLQRDYDKKVRFVVPEPDQLA
jgi:protein-disulfide isomerase